ncbi:MAG TPA: large conductance mechanosensitive channel protein MscL [Flavisolibacter sp.]|nr:large conductance mechanosensitive channel protein MscL [Flavisolibacter sp.]
MGFVKEFKEFALKGNVIDLAIAVVLGAAFGKIVTELTADIIMPLVSLILGKSGINDIAFTIRSTVFPIGHFFQAIIDFILVALVLFIIIRAMNRMQRKREAKAAEPKPPEFTLSEKLLMEIRDSLKRG